MPREKETKRLPHILPTQEQENQFQALAHEFEQMIDDGEQVTHIMAGPGEKIATMGLAAIQLVLDKLSDGNPLWHLPLQSLVGRTTGNWHMVESEGDYYDPKAPKNTFTIFEGDKRAWLTWGEKNGYQIKRLE